MEQKAKQVIMNLAKNNVEGDLSATIGDSQIEWDSYLYRRTYTQEAIIWRAFSQFEVTVDKEGHVVGYVDHSQYENALPATLSQGEINHIIRDSTLIPSEVSLVQVKTERYPEGKATCKALYKVLKPVRKRVYIEVEINAQTRRIIAIRPRADKGWDER